jgi:hypothetical protein
VFPDLPEPKHSTKEILKRHLPYIRTFQEKLKFNTCIQGGEIGFLPKEILECFFGLWPEPIEVSTNGEFIRKGYHVKYKKQIKEILLHITEDLTKKINLGYTLENFNIGICDITRNPELIKKFILMHPEITFNFIDYENPINEPCDGQPQDYLELYNCIKDLKNVSPWAINRIKSRIKNDNLELFQKSCSSFNNIFTVDLVNEKIVKCIRNFKTSSVPLTQENLKIVMTEFNVFPESSLCNNCFRICQDHSISEKLSFRKQYKL